MAEEHISNNSPHPDWSSEDAALTRQFFRTKTGGKLLGLLSQSRPGLYATTVEAAALEGKVVSGWEQCIQLILRAGLMVPTKERIESVEYPNLDTDDGWEAGLQSGAEEEPSILMSQADIERIGEATDTQPNKGE